MGPDRENIFKYLSQTSPPPHSKISWCDYTNTEITVLYNGEYNNGFSRDTYLTYQSKKVP